MVRVRKNSCGHARFDAPTHIPWKDDEGRKVKDGRRRKDDEGRTTKEGRKVKDGRRRKDDEGRTMKKGRKVKEGR